MGLRPRGKGRCAQAKPRRASGCECSRIGPWPALPAYPVPPPRRLHHWHRRHPLCSAGGSEARARR
eukprot:3015005-Ditylum_brightwellii.AAC.1